MKIILFNNLKISNERLRTLLNVLLLIGCIQITGIFYAALFTLFPQFIGYTNVEVLVILLNFWHLALIPLIIIFSKKWSIHLIQEIKPFAFKTFVIVAILSFVIYLFNPIIAHPIAFLQELKNGNLIVFTPAITRSGLSFIITSIAVVISGPIIEELIYRGLIFNYLKRTIPINFAIILSSVIFALIHFNFSGQILILFIYGLVCSISYHQTKSLIVPIVFHFLINLLNQLLSKQTIEINGTLLSIYIPLNIMAALFVIFLIIRLFHRSFLHHWALTKNKERI